MTNQEIFDTAFEGSRAQGFARAANKDGICRLLSDSGLKCHVGHLITKYRPALEWHTLEELSEDQGFSADVDFLYDLRNAHDENTGLIHVALIALAAKYELTIPVGE